MSEHTDRKGWPIHEGAYVKVHRTSQLLRTTTTWRMVVTRFGEDMRGTYVEGVEWRDGKPTGNTRLCRPEDCEVRKPLPSMQEWKRDSAEYHRRARERAQHKKRTRKPRRVARGS